MELLQTSSQEKFNDFSDLLKMSVLIYLLSTVYYTIYLNIYWLKIQLPLTIFLNYNTHWHCIQAYESSAMIYADYT